MSTEDTSARPSATVVLVRDSDGGPEVFMVRRHARLSFGAAFAFPGGVVDPDDANVHEFCMGLSSFEANRNLGVSDGGLDYYSAAVRELFEETGVVLADISIPDQDIDAARSALNAGELSWADVISRSGLQLQCGELHYIGHWVTPPGEEKRYSTRFFLAMLPTGQQAAHCGGELTESCWRTATDILAAGRRGEMTLIYPTLKTLESVARHKNLEELMEWARSRVEWGVTSMIPKIIQRNGKREVVLPGDKDYPGAAT